MATARIGSGSTTPGEGWVDHFQGIYLDVDTSSAHFVGTPQYFTSLGGDGTMWDMTGTSSIYIPTATGFRVYLLRKDGTKLTVKHANQFKFHVNWFGVDQP